MRLRAASWYLAVLISLAAATPRLAAATRAAGETVAPHAASAQESPEQKTARLMDSLKSNGPALYAFLKQMPKGTDLHLHLTGAVYAESYARFAADSHLCVDLHTMTMLPSPCKDGQVDAAQSLTNPVLYRQMIDAWSMRDWHQGVESGHDHFFDAFYRFGAAAHGHTGEMLAEVLTRDADGHVQYVEVMLHPDDGQAMASGAKVQWDDNLQFLRDKLIRAGINDAVALSRRNLDKYESEKDRILNCHESNRALVRPGCEVSVRYIYPVLRAASPTQVFAQMLLAFELARQDRRMVAVNMVQPEDWLVSMRDYELHMRMLNFLKQIYPDVHVTLHAGELAPGLVPPEGLRFHIREAIALGHAERIGHGVDVMYEEDARELLNLMARQNVLVEINLSSNAVVLGVAGNQHPLQVYLKAGVPVALATDDEGVLRSEITREYERAVQEQGLDYPTLKMMVRDGMEHAFLPGQSLWADRRNFVTMKDCAGEKPSARPPGGVCQKFLGGSEKARQQWQLERELAEFESAVAAQ